MEPRAAQRRAERHAIARRLFDALAESCEQWRPVVGYEAYYEVSDRGRVRPSCPRAGSKFGRLLTWQFNRGYPQVELSVDGARKRVLVHRLVAAAFIGPCPVGKEVNHIDGNKQNAAVGNLEYITHDENMTHAAETNLISSGDGHWSRRRAALRGELPVPPAMAEAGS